MGGTYCSNSVSCSAALGVLDAFEQDDVMGNAAARHQQMLGRLGDMLKAYPGLVREVRGAGMMIGWCAYMLSSCVCPNNARRCRSGTEEGRGIRLAGVSAAGSGSEARTAAIGMRPL